MADLWTTLTGYPVRKSWRGVRVPASRPASWPAKYSADLDLWFRGLLQTVRTDPARAWAMMTSNPRKTLAVFTYGGAQKSSLDYLMRQMRPEWLTELGLGRAAGSTATAKNAPAGKSAATGVASRSDRPARDPNATRIFGMTPEAYRRSIEAGIRIRAEAERKASGGKKPAGLTIFGMTPEQYEKSLRAKQEIEARLAAEGRAKQGSRIFGMTPEEYREQAEAAQRIRDEVYAAAKAAVLVEVDFISHPATERAMRSEEWTAKAAAGIRAGVDLYLGVTSS